MVIAVRQALDYDSTARAVGVVVIGFILYLVVAGLAGMVIAGLGGAPAPAPGTP
jgi:hypothetical protein